MKQVSAKQARRNAELSRIKAEKPNTCIFCQLPCMQTDALCHLLPKSVYPQYYTEPKNLWKGHFACHERYDNGTKEYLATLKHIVALVLRFANECEIHRYFGI